LPTTKKKDKNKTEAITYRESNIDVKNRAKILRERERERERKERHRWS
jgi:hypothetical protein